MVLASKAIKELEVLKRGGYFVFSFQGWLSPGVQLLTPLKHLLGCAVVTSLRAISVQSRAKSVIPVMCPS